VALFPGDRSRSIGSSSWHFPRSPRSQIVPNVTADINRIRFWAGDERTSRRSAAKLPCGPERHLLRDSKIWNRRQSGNGWRAIIATFRCGAMFRRLWGQGGLS
jgi:hypothetical protein